MLEAISHGSENNSFVTLTYEGEIRSLVPEHLQLWLKRYRKRVSPAKVRYFAVGEYGDITWRPHYHVALFGRHYCFGGARVSGACQCPACLDVRETWGYGHVMVGRLETASAQYIAGYCTKKMTHRSDIRLDGRHPEFARMSLKPGIGADALWNVASEMMRLGLDDRGDVPTTLLQGGKSMPLGRYLTRRLRRLVGKDEKAPVEVVQEALDKLQVLREYAWQNGSSVAEVFAELNTPYAAQVAAKGKLREKRL